MLLWQKEERKKALDKGYTLEGVSMGSKDLPDIQGQYQSN